MSPVTKVPDFVPVALLTTTSPTHQSQSWTCGRTPGPISSSQNSVSNSSSSHEPAKMPNHPHPQTRSRDATVHPDHTKQVTVFMGHRHLLSTPTLPLIRLPLLSITPQDFTNASLRHTQNSRHLTLKIALSSQQDNSSQNVLRQILRYDVPNNTSKQNEDGIKTQVVISRQSALGYFPKMRASGLFLFQRASALATQTRSVENHKVSWVINW